MYLIKFHTKSFFQYNPALFFKIDEMKFQLTSDLSAFYLGRLRALRERPLLQDNEHRDEIESLLQKFIIDDDTLMLIMHMLEDEMDKGLNSNSEFESDLKMIPTYVRDLPDGTETEVKLDEDRNVDIHSKIFVVPERLMNGNGEALFDHLAQSICYFMKQRNIGRRNKNYPLGFTFSFPCKQTSLNSAELIAWTKGFSCSGVEGTDVVKQLTDAINRKDNSNVKVMALVNDTVGTLMTCAHKFNDCYIGVIFGTGTNACYVEQLDRVEKWNPDEMEPPQIIINTEWGAFGDHGCLEFLRTKYDIDVDNASVNPGKQYFEKMISGMYLGELARLILLDLIEKQLLFPGLLQRSPGKIGDLREMFTPGGFYSRYVSDIEQDEGLKFNETKKKLEDLGFDNPTYEDCAIVRNVCKHVSYRAALLSAAAIAVLINRINKPHVTVGVDGSLYRYHPRFKTNLEIALSRLVDRNIKYRVVLSEDGSGKGAALVAAVADRVNNARSRKVSIDEGISSNNL
ncbi:hypothetical protein GJ496_002906 [Pomphorhynchus laevis]|nr:hypothetical protein GJ496_002906 [Pomphorhynchus laevis]